jgi:hypothetical protein
MAADCFAGRFESGLAAELVRVVTTIEGDAIVTVLRPTGDGSVVLFTDATRDAFGTQAWFAHVCDGYDAAVGQPTNCAEGAELGAIDALQVDGVWIFQHNPSIAMDALHGGFAEIRDGCLYVDDTIVVWHVSQLDEARQTVAAVRAGERPELLVGGGGISIVEGGQQVEIPAVILERCAAIAVWFGSP